MQIPVLKFEPISPKSSMQLLALREGQILRGFVQSKDGSNLVLNLGGVKVIAQTDLEVSAGQLIWLEAVEVKPSKIVFKLFAKETNLSFRDKIPDTVFSKLDIPPSFVAGKVIEVLMFHGLPISKEVVEEITEKIPGQASPDEIEVLVNTNILLKNKGLPVTEETQQLLGKLFTGETEPEEVVYALKLLNEVKDQQYNLPNLFFAWWQNELQQGEIYLWQYQKGNKSLEESYKALALHFYTQNLGELWVKLIHLSGKLSLTLATENSQAITLFREHLAKLEDMLKAAGYKLGIVSYKLSKVESVFSCFQDETRSEYRGIDIKV